jgi:hypothetical protein
MNYYLQVINPDTKLVERVRINGQNILQLLHYMRKLGLSGVVVKANTLWGNYKTFYTLGSDGRIYKWVKS